MSESDIQTIDNNQNDLKWYKENVLCETTCPLNIVIKSIIQLILNKEIDKACELLLQYNPFPSITGRLCKYTCEENCVRRRDDGSVQIQYIEKFLGDYIIDNNIMLPFNNAVSKKAAVIGAGLTGLSTAYYLKIQGFDTIDVYEKQNKSWGCLNYIPGFELEKSILEKSMIWLSNHNINIKHNHYIDKEGIEELAEKYDAVIIANGNPLILKHKHMKDTIEVTDYLNSFESTKIGSNVIVYGINEASLPASRTALRMGANKVEIYYENSKSQINIAEKYISKARQEGIRVHYYHKLKNVSKFINNKNEILKAEFIKTKIDPRSNELTEIKHTETGIECDSFINCDFLSIENAFLSNNIENDKQYKDLKEHKAIKDISKANVFFYDDVPLNSTNCVDIIENARNLSDRVNIYLLNKHTDLYNMIFNPEFTNIKKEIITDIIDEIPSESKPIKPRELSLSKRLRSLEPIVRNYTGTELFKECKRCYKCSYQTIITETDKCIECGICVDICPNDCFSSEQGLNSYLAEQLEIVPDFINNLFGIYEEAESPYNADTIPFFTNSRACLRCFKCITNCPVDIIKMLNIKKTNLSEFESYNKEY